jgi:electron transport complex protein RnfB
MIEKKPKQPLIAIIREAECIGCTKCITACPFDAILGSAKQMHTVIGDECIGCKLCIAPCPVDCIDLIPLTIQEDLTKEKAGVAKIRYQARQKRIQKEHDITPIFSPESIQAAILRAKSKKLSL